MMATGESHTPAPLLDLPELASLLRRKVAGEPFPHSFIHEVDSCSAPPEYLVFGREHAPGDADAWYICSPADCHQTAGGRPTRRRKRKVRGGCSGERWHPEVGKRPIPSPDGEPVAYTRTLSYLLMVRNPTGTSPRFRKERLGWCMLEVGLELQGGGADQQLVICKVYRSPRADPVETSTEASLASRGTPYPAPPCERDSQIQSIRLAVEYGRPVTVDNSYNTEAPAGTVITKARDISKSMFTSIVLKPNIIMMNIKSTVMIGQLRFLAMVLHQQTCVSFV